jgi:hypothetical protein
VLAFRQEPNVNCSLRGLLDFGFGALAFGFAFLDLVLDLGFGELFSDRIERAMRFLATSTSVTVTITFW